MDDAGLFPACRVAHSITSSARARSVVGERVFNVAHRARERLVSERTALINHLRALLLERGIVAAQGRRKLQEALSTFANEGGIEALSPRIRVLIRRVTAELRHQGHLVNSKRVRRLMREHGLSPRQRRRYVTTTDSDHAAAWR